MVAIAESAKKLSGELPTPSSSFLVLDGAVAELTTRDAKRTRPPRSCTKCGEIGRRADTCGITHNIPKAEADQ